jgi:hypothetical protein
VGSFTSACQSMPYVGTLNERAGASPCLAWALDCWTSAILLACYPVVKVQLLRSM